VAVTLARVIDPGTPANQYLQPESGKRLVGIELILSNQGQTTYSTSPLIGSILIDSEGQQFTPNIHSVQEGQSFGGAVTVSPHGRSKIMNFERNRR
jgi:hypothetical protein